MIGWIRIFRKDLYFGFDIVKSSQGKSYERRKDEPFQ